MPNGIKVSAKVMADLLGKHMSLQRASIYYQTVSLVLTVFRVCISLVQNSGVSKKMLETTSLGRYHGTIVCIYPIMKRNLAKLLTFIHENR